MNYNKEGIMEKINKKEKPVCKLKNRGLINWDVLHIVIKTLKDNKLEEEAKRFKDEAYKCKSPEEFVAVVNKYVKVE
jgi:hypothetical protein